MNVEISGKCSILDFRFSVTRFVLSYDMWPRFEEIRIQLNRCKLAFSLCESSASLYIARIVKAAIYAKTNAYKITVMYF